MKPIKEMTDEELIRALAKAQKDAINEANPALRKFLIADIERITAEQKKRRKKVQP